MFVFAFDTLGDSVTAEEPWDATEIALIAGKL